MGSNFANQILSSRNAQLLLKDSAALWLEEMATSFFINVFKGTLNQLAMFVPSKHPSTDCTGVEPKNKENITIWLTTGSDALFPCILKYGIHVLSRVTVSVNNNGLRLRSFPAWWKVQNYHDSEDNIHRFFRMTPSHCPYRDRF